MSNTGNLLLIYLGHYKKRVALSENEKGNTQ